MPQISATDSLLDLVKRSQLMTEADLAAALSAIRQQGGGKLPVNADLLANQLVARQCLSRWQADHLLAGRHKGFRLGHYRLLRPLGAGGMGRVYLAEHELMHRRAAIKVLPPTKVRDGSYLDRFYREARASATLDHPNVVRIYDVGCQGHNHYIAMEYHDGQDLQVRVTTGKPLTSEHVADCISQAARGLQHAHDMHLIHRDVKPTNLVVDRHGVLKILDLGIAKLPEDLPSTVRHHSDTGVLGTVDYLAPEQALNAHNVDARTDVYSLGCTMYFLLAGHPPFPHGSVAQRLVQHQLADPPNLRTIRPDVPHALVTICEQMMAKQREQRMQTAREVVGQINKRCPGLTHATHANPIAWHTELRTETR